MGCSHEQGMHEACAQLHCNDGGAACLPSMLTPPPPRALPGPPAQLPWRRDMHWRELGQQVLRGGVRAAAAGGAFRWQQRAAAGDAEPQAPSLH